MFSFNNFETIVDPKRIAKSKLLMKEKIRLMYRMHSIGSIEIKLVMDSDHYVKI